MAETPVTSRLAPRCGFCSIKVDLRRCSRCKIMFYCCREHQVADGDAHKHACKLVKSRQELLEQKEQAVDMHPRQIAFIQPDLFTKNPMGLYWKRVGEYIWARYALVDAILEINTYDAVLSALDHLMDLLQSCRCDKIGMGDRVPALFLRLGRDQDCYDFVKFYATAFLHSSRYDYGLKSLPFLDIKNANVFESLFDDRFFSRLCLHHVVALTLLKFKLLLDCIDQQNILLLRSMRIIKDQDYVVTLSEDVIRNIHSFSVRSSITSENEKLMERREYAAHIQELLWAEVQQLYNFVDDANKHIWPALLNRSLRLTGTPPPVPAPGGIGQMKSVLRASMDSWLETPGAIDFIQRCRNE